MRTPRLAHLFPPSWRSLTPGCYVLSRPRFTSRSIPSRRWSCWLLVSSCLARSVRFGYVRARLLFARNPCFSDALPSGIGDRSQALQNNLPLILILVSPSSLINPLLCADRSYRSANDLAGPAVTPGREEGDAAGQARSRLATCSNVFLDTHANNRNPRGTPHAGWGTGSPPSLRRPTLVRYEIQGESAAPPDSDK